MGKRVRTDARNLKLTCVYHKRIALCNFGNNNTLETALGIPKMTLEFVQSLLNLVCPILTKFSVSQIDQMTLETALGIPKMTLEFVQSLLNLVCPKSIR